MLKRVFDAAASLARRFGWKPTSSTAPPSIASHRSESGRAAVVFVHGFTGNWETWTEFIDLLRQERSVSSWDIFALSYPSGLRIDVPNLWAADPSIETLALELCTAFSQLPLSGYERIALVAHSMGGLVVQRAILIDDTLRARLSHVFCFGTPSAGLVKAMFGMLLKRQLRDMGSESQFIRSLREAWRARIGDQPRFTFWVLQGDRDEFVSAESSLRPFAQQSRRVVPGNHVAIVRPTDRSHLGYQLVLQELSGTRAAMPAIDGARLALELGHFQHVVEALLPKAEGLDDAASVDLALALDGLGRSEEALAVLEKSPYRDSAEALGVLGGRYKRRWLTQRLDADLRRARDLYVRGLELAVGRGDHAQCYYHAINIAFLDLLAAPATVHVPDGASIMARQALEHCLAAATTRWNWATQGEAWLMLGDLDKAERMYQLAIAQTPSPRDRQSMYSQAIRVAIRAGGEDAGRAIERVFGVARLS